MRIIANLFDVLIFPACSCNVARVVNTRGLITKLINSNGRARGKRSAYWQEIDISIRFNFNIDIRIDIQFLSAM